MDNNIGVIGSGGREHTLSETLTTDSEVDDVFCLPGNGGTALSEGIVNLDYDDFDDLYRKLKDNSIDLVVVGPEGPLTEGIADRLSDKGIDTFGFEQKAAKLESSKVYADEFKREFNVSHPDFKVCESYSGALGHIEDRFLENDVDKLWIKADELCGGKGALSASNLEEGKEALETLMKGKPKCGEGDKVVIQENLAGDEATILTFTDGETYIQMPSMQDHKSTNEGGEGPNTGGMGAYSPTPLVDGRFQDKFERKIVEPTKEGINERNLESSGILYFGLMEDQNKEPYVLEYNVRFGDPEAQPVLPLLESDLYPILKSAVNQDLENIEEEISWSDQTAVCVVLSTEGYPVDYGDENEIIEGVEEAEGLENLRVYHAGTTIDKGSNLRTDGGRILGVTGIGDTIEQAKSRAYDGVEKIEFDGMHYRTDIAEKGVTEEVER